MIATPAHHVISMLITSTVTEIPFCATERERKGTTKINPNKMHERTIRMIAAVMSAFGFSIESFLLPH